MTEPGREDLINRRYTVALSERHTILNSICRTAIRRIRLGAGAEPWISADRYSRSSAKRHRHLTSWAPDRLGVHLSAFHRNVRNRAWLYPWEVSDIWSEVVICLVIGALRKVTSR